MHKCYEFGKPFSPTVCRHLKFQMTVKWMRNHFFPNLNSQNPFGPQIYGPNAKTYDIHSLFLNFPSASPYIHIHTHIKHIWYVYRIDLHSTMNKVLTSFCIELCRECLYCLLAVWAQTHWCMVDNSQQVCVVWRI